MSIINYDDLAKGFLSPGCCLTSCFCPLTGRHGKILPDQALQVQVDWLPLLMISSPGWALQKLTLRKNILIRPVRNSENLSCCLCNVGGEQYSVWSHTFTNTPTDMQITCTRCIVHEVLLQAEEIICRKYVCRRIFIKNQLSKRSWCLLKDCYCLGDYQVHSLV